MRKLAIVVALSSTVLATPALARDGAWYVGGEFGAMIVEDIEFDVAGTQNAVVVDHDYGYDGSLFAGYDLGPARLEVEVGYKKAQVDGVTNNIGLPLTPIGINDFGGGSTSALSAMFNAMLDVGEDDGINGFIGGGVGYAKVSANNMRTFSNAPSFLDDSDGGLAWQAFAGVRAPITPNIDVLLKYRFFNVDNVDLVAADSRVAETRLRTHSLLGGIVFNFGAAPPPPPPAPPLPPPPPPPVEVPPPPVQEAVGPFIVFFDWDRSEITPQAAAILDNAASAYQQTGSAQVVLAGHADRSGSASYNVGLSQRRADSVRSYLAGRGIPDGAMATEAFGEGRPLVETADGVREPQNRRVEITFGPGSGM